MASGNESITACSTRSPDSLGVRHSVRLLSPSITAQLYPLRASRSARRSVPGWTLGFLLDPKRITSQTGRSIVVKRHVDMYAFSSSHLEPEWGRRCTSSTFLGTANRHTSKPTANSSGNKPPSRDVNRRYSRHVEKTRDRTSTSGRDASGNPGVFIAVRSRSTTNYEGWPILLVIEQAMRVPRVSPPTGLHFGMRHSPSSSRQTSFLSENVRCQANRKQMPRPLPV